MEKKISTQRDLYNKVLPALKTKKNELLRSGIRIVKEEDIWNYNKVTKWRSASSLSLAGIVDDILNTKNEEYENYVIKKINEQGE
mgnify:CR=1 FL=1|jgi:hypothetical protein